MRCTCDSSNRIFNTNHEFMLTWLYNLPHGKFYHLALRRTHASTIKSNVPFIVFPFISVNYCIYQFPYRRVHNSLDTSTLFTHDVSGTGISPGVNMLATAKFS